MTSMRRLINLVESAIVRENSRIEGLPPGVRFQDRGIQQALDRGAFRVVAKPGIRDGVYELEFHPADVTGAKQFQPRAARDRMAYYDPELATLELLDPEEPVISRYSAKPLDHVQHEPEPLPGDDIMYRGMSADEYQSIQDSGQVWSKGEANFTSQDGLSQGQEGLTYWTDDINTARWYASGTLAHKATFGRPAYIVAAKRVPEEDTRHVPGVGSNEIGVTRPVPASDLVAVWRGRPYFYEPGRVELRPRDFDYSENPELRRGSSSDPSVYLHWERIA